jgi:hypothetical protein
MTDTEEYGEEEVYIGDADDFFRERSGVVKDPGVTTTITNSTRKARSAALRGDGRVQVNVVLKDGRMVPVFKNPGHEPGINQNYLMDNMTRSGFSFKKYLQKESGGQFHLNEIKGYQITGYE